MMPEDTVDARPARPGLLRTIARPLALLLASALASSACVGGGAAQGDDASNTDDQSDDLSTGALQEPKDTDFLKLLSAHDEPSGQNQGFSDEVRIQRMKEMIQCAILWQNEAMKTDRASSICHFDYVPGSSNAVSQMWKLPDPEENTMYITLAFTGSRTDLSKQAAKDWLTNLQSQFSKVKHKNQLTGQEDALMVGGGWQARWAEELPLNRPNGSWKGLLDQLLRKELTLKFIVVGHSQGAANAILAGHDISQWLQANHRPNADVTVFAFNPPRPGGLNYAADYRDVINGDRLNYFQLTRSLDPVTPLPVNTPVVFKWSFPVWETKADTVPAGVHYCAQYNASAASFINPIANHSMTRWLNDFSQIPDSHLLCMSRAW